MGRQLRLKNGVEINSDVTVVATNFLALFLPVLCSWKFIRKGEEVVCTHQITKTLPYVMIKTGCNSRFQVLTSLRSSVEIKALVGN